MNGIKNFLSIILFLIGVMLLLNLVFILPINYFQEPQNLLEAIIRISIMIFIGFINLSIIILIYFISLEEYNYHKYYKNGKRKNRKNKKHTTKRSKL